MTIASDLLERHIQTLVADPAQWQTLIADDMVWELANAPAIGHPARLNRPGRDHSACDLVPKCRGKLSVHRTKDICIRRSPSSCRASQGGSVDQVPRGAFIVKSM